MSNTSVRIPFYIKTDTGVRIATDGEIEQYKNQPKHKSVLTKWTKANRSAEAAHHIKNGHAYNIAWAKAFEAYPDANYDAEHPRFFIKQ